MRSIIIEPGNKMLINGDLTELSIHIGACRAKLHIAKKGSFIEFSRDGRKVKKELLDQAVTHESDTQRTIITYQAVEVQFRQENRVIVFIFWYHELRDTDRDNGIYANHNYDYAYYVDSETVELLEYRSQEQPNKCKWDARGHCICANPEAYVYNNTRFTDREKYVWETCPCASNPEAENCLHPGQGLSVQRY